MIYETAWHEEDQVGYADSDCYGAWLSPDNSWDGVNTWNLRLSNHARQAALYAVAAQWADSVRTGAIGTTVQVIARDVDLDGEDEYLIRNHRIFAVFEKYGGRCVLGCSY